MEKRVANISWKGLKIFAQIYSGDDLWLALTFDKKVRFCFWSFVSEKFVERVKDFGTKVNKYSLVSKHINIFATEVEFLL